MNNTKLIQVKGQVVTEYVILFAIALTLMVVASNLMSNAQVRMSQTRDIGIRLIMGQ